MSIVILAPRGLANLSKMQTPDPRLVEPNRNQKRDEWMAALDEMNSLKPRTVVVGHKRIKNDDGRPRAGQELRSFESVPFDSKPFYF